MSDYRSAYEKYYKNINNVARGKKDINKYVPLSGGFINPMNAKELSSNSNLGNYLVKRIIRELIGATLLLVIFFGLKFIPLKEVRDVYTMSKQLIGQNFDYDDTIETFNYVKIGNFKLEDLKKENLEAKSSEFIDYLKNASNKQFEIKN